MLSSKYPPWSSDCRSSSPLHPTTNTRTSYQHHLSRRPFLTQVTTTAVPPLPLPKHSHSHPPQILFGSGDLLAQHTVEKKPLSQSDTTRTCRMIFYGGGSSASPFPSRTNFRSILRSRSHKMVRLSPEEHQTLLSRKDNACQGGT
jgi:hypothetical protein